MSRHRICLTLGYGTKSNVVVLRTFSKIYGLAECAGYAIPILTWRGLIKHGSPSMSLPWLVAAEAALGDKPAGLHGEQPWGLKQIRMV